MIAFAGAMPLHYEDMLEGTIDRVTDLLAAVPVEVSVGIHLCYGDPGHKHIIEPADLGSCVKFANGLCARSPGVIAYIDVPVPRNRNDDAYYEPLSGLQIDATRLVLGLVWCITLMVTRARVHEWPLLRNTRGTMTWQ